MQVAIQLGLLIAGFILLMKGADWFVEGASKIADKFGIPQLVIGLTIVAMGTSLPEAAVSISAAVKGSAEITIGNVLGSNVLNVLIILGLTSVICAIPVKKSTVRYEIPFTIGITAALAAMGLADGKVTIRRVDVIEPGDQSPEAVEAYVHAALKTMPDSTKLELLAELSGLLQKKEA